MRAKRATGKVPLLMVGLFLSSFALEASEPELLNRSIYMPIEFRLCEHLGNAVFYQNDSPVSTMPASRVFLFTYYPKLDRILPELVRVRVEGRYEDGDDPFVAKLAVTSGGVHSAHRTRAADTGRQVLRQKHKLDVRLEPKVIALRCPRICARAAAAKSAAELEAGGEASSSTSEDGASPGPSDAEKRD